MYPYLPSAPSHNDTVDRESFPGGRKCEDDTFMTPATCTDTCLVYLVTCRKCSKQSVGKAEGTLREANSEHRYDIDQQGTLVGRHFASVCGYDNWSLAIIDKCAPAELSRRHKFWL